MFRDCNALRNRGPITLGRCPKPRRYSLAIALPSLPGFRYRLMAIATHKHKQVPRPQAPSLFGPYI